LLESVIVEPGGEEHLEGAAAEPVALLVVRADAADAGAEAFRDEGGECLVAARGDGELPLGGGGAADEADFVGGPGEGAHPVEFVVRIGEWGAEDVVIAFGVKAAAFVHFDQGVAVLDGFEFSGHVAGGAEGDVPIIEVVGRAGKDDRVFLRRVLRTIDVGLHALAVAHGDHDFALDDGDGFQFFFRGVALGDYGWIGRAGLRYRERRKGDGEAAEGNGARAGGKFWHGGFFLEVSFGAGPGNPVENTIRQKRRTGMGRDKTTAWKRSVKYGMFAISGAS